MISFLMLTMFWIFYIIISRRGRKRIHAAEDRFMESVKILYVAEKTNGGLRNHRNKVA